MDRMLPSSEWSWNHNLRQAVVEPAISRNMFVQFSKYFPNFEVNINQHLRCTIAFQMQTKWLEFMTIGSWKNRTTWDVLTLSKNQCDKQPIPTGDWTYHGNLFFWMINSWLSYQQAVNTKHRNTEAKLARKIISSPAHATVTLSCITLGVQSYYQRMTGVFNH